MGFTPQDVDAMSLWQFLAAAEGYAEAHMPADKKKNRMTDAEADDLSSWLDSKG